jgi:hypothetical protein
VIYARSRQRGARATERRRTKARRDWLWAGRVAALYRGMSEPADERTDLRIALSAAVRDSAAERLRLRSFAERRGAAGARCGESFIDLSEEIDELERSLLSTGAHTEPPHAEVPHDDAERARPALVVQECCALARHAVLEGFSRAARHDIVNALGAARNALLLIDEGAQGAELERLRDIARRNVHNAEHLVRVHFNPAATRPSGAPAARSAGNERHDLRSPGERDHGNTLGL